MKRKWIYLSGHFLIGILLKRIIKDINGLDNVPSNRAFLVVANHESYIDPVIIKVIFDKHFGMNVYYLTKKESFNNPFKRLFFESAGTIQIDRQLGESALEKAVEMAKSGEIIGMFPEGTRSKDGSLQRGKTGAVRIALSAKCLILPVCINNTYEIWPRQKKLPSLRKEVVINIGKPISLVKYYDKLITRELLREITDKDVMPEIARLSNQEYDA